MTPVELRNLANKLEEGHYSMADATRAMRSAATALEKASQVKGKTTTRFDYQPHGPVIDVTIDHSALGGRFAQMFNSYARSGHGKRAKITSQYGAIVAKRVSP